MTGFKAFSERSLAVQLGLLVVACQLLAHVLTIAITLSRLEGPDPVRFLSLPALKAGAIGELVRHASRDELETVLALVARAMPELSVVPAKADDIAVGMLGEAGRSLARVIPAIADRVGPPRSEQGLGLPMLSTAMILVRLDETRAFRVDATIEAYRLPVESIILRLTLLLVVVPLALLTLWVLRSLTAPLGRLAASADRFSIDLDATPLKVEGSLEMRRLAHAFNLMRDRIRALVEARARMLAAVSHDLRTPITRVRLRVEAQPPGEERTRTLRDLKAMDDMIGQSLTYLRDQSQPLRRSPVDLSALLSTVADDFEDAGDRVFFEADAPAVVEADAALVERAVTNVIENAVKYGTLARVHLDRSQIGALAIVVDDDGPGIVESDKPLALEPFVRGDQARSTPGFGLGLSIAGQIFERHGGSIRLEDLRPHGLRVRMTLPAATPVPSGAAGRNQG